MTLHVTQISRRYILQVSDRLVSCTTGIVHDPLANKNLIYCARDAIVSVGYTGLAYGLFLSNKNMPTDEWIAQILWGSSIPRGRDGKRPAALVQGKNPRWLDIGQSTQLLCNALQNSVSKLPRHLKQYPFEVIIAGWKQARRRGFIPVVVQLIKPENTEEFIIQRPERYWYIDNCFALGITPDAWIPSVEQLNIRNILRKASLDESEELLVKSIRRVASLNPEKVGSHCMSILLPPPGAAPLRVRFIPNSLHTGVLVNKNQDIKQEFPIAFSPWIIGPNLIAAPSLQVGYRHLQVGAFEVIIEAPSPSKGILGVMGSQNRPSHPV